MIEVIILTNIIHNQCSIFLFCFSICFSCSLIFSPHFLILLFFSGNLGFRNLSVFTIVFPRSPFYNFFTGICQCRVYIERRCTMNKLTYCPFIKGSCRSDCVFHTPFNIALNNGNSAQCELAAFASCSDEESIKMVMDSLKNLHAQSR